MIAESQRLQGTAPRRALRDLDAVREELLSMAYAIEALLDMSRRTLAAGDLALAREARRQDTLIDSGEVRLEQQCLRARMLHESATTRPTSPRRFSL
jgi:phosphate uptake regulator